MALRSGEPVWPIACYGGEHFSDNIRHLRRTEYHVNAGEPFTVASNGTRVSRDVRQEIVDEMMYQIAALMPARYRGYYADVENAEEEYLRFTPPRRSNLAAISVAPRPALP
jgi:1-acyl-sn-glycerol-3-phosphate acyltransferase